MGVDQVEGLQNLSITDDLNPASLPQYLGVNGYSKALV